MTKETKQALARIGSLCRRFQRYAVKGGAKGGDYLCGRYDMAGVILYDIKLIRRELRKKGQNK